MMLEFLQVGGTFDIGEGALQMILFPYYFAFRGEEGIEALLLPP
jgi:hypothetical protein